MSSLRMMHRRDFLRLSGLAAIHTVAPRSAASQEANRLKDLEALVTAKMAEYHVPGVALGIVKAGVAVDDESVLQIRGAPGT